MFDVWVNLWSLSSEGLKWCVLGKNANVEVNTQTSGGARYDFVMRQLCSHCYPDWTVSLGGVFCIEDCRISGFMRCELAQCSEDLSRSATCSVANNWYSPHYTEAEHLIWHPRRSIHHNSHSGSKTLKQKWSVGSPAMPPASHLPLPQ